MRLEKAAMVEVLPMDVPANTLDTHPAQENYHPSSLQATTTTTTTYKIDSTPVSQKSDYYLCTSSPKYTKTLSASYSIHTRNP
jgi:hypothetical protein